MNPQENKQDEKEQESRRTTVDSVNDLINKSQSAYKVAKNAQKYISRIRTAVAAAQAVGSSLSNPIGIAAIIVGIILIVIFIILFGGNLQHMTSSTKPGPGTEENALPNILYFQGGYAYLTCDKNQIARCPKFPPDSQVTIYAIVHIDSDFPSDTDKDKAIIRIGPFATSFFNLFNLNSANVNPKPYTRNISLSNYNWTLNTVMNRAEKLTTDPDSYVISITDKIKAQAQKGDKNELQLSLEGFGPITTSAPPKGVPNYPGITYNIYGPNNCTVCQAKVRQPITYNIKLSYDSSKATTSLDKISVTFTAPKAIFGFLPYTKTWKLSEHINNSETNSTVKHFSFNVTLNPILNNTKAKVKISINGATPSDSGGNNGGGGGSSDPSCNNKYTARNSPKGNFGDPNCELSKVKNPAKLSMIYSLLKEKDPKNAACWYKIIKCESGFWQNSYYANSTSGRGAYGLFQMNPGSRYTEYDNGKVEWRLQTTNAINYNNKIIHGSFLYWECSAPQYADCRK